MKLSTSLLLLASITLLEAAASPGQNGQQILKAEPGQDAGQYLIELSPGETRWVTEDEKWALRRVRLASDARLFADHCGQAGQNFMDITETPQLGMSREARTRSSVRFPAEATFQEDLGPLLKNLSKSEMRENLEVFTAFHTRYYKSTYGAQSAQWLYERIDSIIAQAGAAEHGVYVKKFDHSWGQPSLIATIPGQSNKTVIIGAHQDSINLFLPSVLSAPGADDDGSGTVTILEAFRTLLQSPKLVGGQGENTIEFQWYSAEEGGLLGSQAIFSAYEQQGKDVKAMLQQDMTGFVKKTIAAGEQESVGVITDFVDAGLTEFIKTIVTTVCRDPAVLARR